MDTRFLACFVAFTECRSIAKAARQLNLPPSTLALRIRALEDELGFPLVARSGRVVTPTQAGAALAVRATAILRDVKDLATLGDDAEPRGLLRMGVAPSAITTMLCDVLPALTRKYPNLEIVVQKGPSSRLYSMLCDGDIDLAFLFRPPFSLSKGLVWRRLRTERYVVISAGTETEMDPSTLLRKRPFIRYDRSLWSGQIAENYLRAKRIRPRERVELDALEAIAVLVDRGLGISLIPDRELALPAGLKIMKHSLDEPAPTRELGLLWQVGSSRSSLIEIIKREALTTV